MDGETGTSLEYRKLSKCPKYNRAWQYSYENYIGRLVQGILGRLQATNAMFFIKKSKAHQNRFRDVTYESINCNYKVEKAKPN